MISRWKKKKQKFEKNRLKKLMHNRQKHNRHKKSGKGITADIYQTSIAFDLLSDKEFGIQRKQIQPLKSHTTIKIPTIFSISENPDETIATLSKMFFYGSKLFIDNITIDHSECKILEIAASTIMDVIILSIRSYHLKNGHNIVLNGVIPTNGQVKDVFMGSGLASHLQLSFKNKMDFNSSKMRLFKLRSGIHDSKETDKVATELTQYIIECMKTQGYTVLDPGINELSTLFGEVLDNCSVHGGEKSCWYALGHFQNPPHIHTYGETQLVIFNLGNTIYEQIKEDSSEKIKEQLAYLTKKQKRFFSNKWDEEMLFTLFSIQEGISRLREPEINGNKKRGTGTIKLIENFEKIGQTKGSDVPLMTLTSGSTQIRFDGKYMLQSTHFDESFLGSNDRKIIAFNEDNDICLPPNFDNVVKLQQYFPGTIISMRFFFDKRYLKELVNEKER